MKTQIILGTVGSFLVGLECPIMGGYLSSKIMWLDAFLSGTGRLLVILLALLFWLRAWGIIVIKCCKKWKIKKGIGKK